MICGKELVSPSIYTRTRLNGSEALRSGTFTTLLRQGHVLTINSAEELFRNIGSLCESIENTLLVPVTAAISASWPADQVSYQSWNDYDLVILCKSGATKYWTHPPTMPFPTAVVSPNEPSSTADWQLVDLQAGGLLYIPRGWWYREEPSEWTNLTVKLSFRNMTGLDVLARIATRLGLVDFMRMDVPRFADLKKQSAYLTKIQQEIIRECAEPGLILDFLKDMRAMFDSPRTLGLPWIGNIDFSDAELDWQIISKIRFVDGVHDAPDNDFIEVLHETKRIILDNFTGNLLRRVTRDLPITVRQTLKAANEPEERRRLLNALIDLLNGGLIIFRG